jgi:hypothetical protein
VAQEQSSAPSQPGVGRQPARRTPGPAHADLAEELDPEVVEALSDLVDDEEDEDAAASADAVLDFPSPDEEAADVADLVDPVSASLAFFLDSDG